MKKFFAKFHHVQKQSCHVLVSCLPLGLQRVKRSVGGRSFFFPVEIGEAETTGSRRFCTGGSWILLHCLFQLLLCMQADAMGAEVINSDSDNNDWLSSLTYDQWVSLPISGSRPLARYKGVSLCSAFMNGEKLLLAFGGYYGKYNNELQPPLRLLLHMV